MNTLVLPDVASPARGDQIRPLQWVHKQPLGMHSIDKPALALSNGPNSLSCENAARRIHWLLESADLPGLQVPALANSAYLRGAQQ